MLALVVRDPLIPGEATGVRIIPLDRSDQIRSTLSAPSTPAYAM